MSATPAKRTRDPHASREKLLQTAINLVWNNSYESVGVNEICTQAEVTKGCFYHHFSSKAELFCEAAELYWHEKQQALNAIVNPSFNGLEQLIALSKFGKDIQETYSHSDNPVAGCPFVTTGAALGHKEPLIAKSAQEMDARMHVYLATIARNLQTQGFAEANHSPDQAARLMMHFYYGLMQYGRAHQSYAVVERDMLAGIAHSLSLKPEYIAQFSKALDR